MDPLPDIDAVLFDIGGTLVAEAPPATPTAALVARPLPGVVDALRDLARHHRLAAVTDTAVMREADVRALLAPSGLDDLLEVVVTSADVGRAKPDPASVRRALELLGVEPGRALLIGDRDVDRGAAAASGTHFVATDRGLPDAVDRARIRLGGPFAAAADAVRPVDRRAEAAARAHLERLTKPPGSLGRLEDLGARLSAIAGACPPPAPSPAAIAVFAADHGVAAAGVSAWPQEVTAQMVANLASGGAAICVLAGQVGATLRVIDVGVAADLSGLAGVDHVKVRWGTADLSRGPAMTTAEVGQALDVGAVAAAELVAGGARLLVTGEMGIANTTASAALISVLAARPAEAVTGRGAGADDPALARKVAVVAAASARARPWLDPLSVLAEVGGLEIAALAGFVVGGAAAGVPVVIDGVIADAALMVAEALVPGVVERTIAGHRSVEPGATAVLEHLGLVPVLDLGLALGEGSGACLAVPVIEAAAAVLSGMATFDGAGVSER